MKSPGKSSGGAMPNPMTGAPGAATPGLPSPGKSAGSMPSPTDNPSRIGAQTSGGQGMADPNAINALAQGSQQTGQIVSPPGPMNPGGGGGRPGWGAPISDNFGGPDQSNLSPTLKMQGDILKRWDGTSGNVPNPYRSPITTTQGYVPPNTPTNIPGATPLGPQTRPTGGATAPGAPAAPVVQPQGLGAPDFASLERQGGMANSALAQQMADQHYGGNMDALRSAFNTASYGAGGQAVQHGAGSGENRPWILDRMRQLGIK